MTPTSIETMTGQFVDLVHPDPATIDIRDIAWATSRMPRYVGHTISAIPYTIGQHSIFVTQLVTELFKADYPDLRRSFCEFVAEKCASNLELKKESLAQLKSGASKKMLLEMLMHDASEAYVVDVPTPLKEAEGFQQAYREVEDNMTGAIRFSFDMGDLDPVHEVILKWADRAALTIEAHHLIRSRGTNWTRLMKLDMTSMQLFEQPKEPIKVYEEFCNLFFELATP